MLPRATTLPKPLQNVCSERSGTGPDAFNQGGRPCVPAEVDGLKTVCDVSLGHCGDRFWHHHRDLRRECDTQ